MCRNIRPLFNFEPASTPDEVRLGGAAAMNCQRKGAENAEKAQRPPRAASAPISPARPQETC
jgi:hypothetical protein